MSIDPRYTIFAARAVFDARLTAMDVRVLAALGTFTDRQGWCYPSQTTLAKQLGTGRTNVTKSIKALVRAGYVQSVEQERENGAQTVNLYRVLMDFIAPGAVCEESATAEIVALLPVSPSDTPLSLGETGLDVVVDVAKQSQNVAPPVTRRDTPLSPGETPPVTRRDTELYPLELTPERKRAARLSASWTPRANEISFGVAGGLSEPEVLAAAEHMRDWAASSPKAVKLDWDKTFRNWLRTTISDAKRGRRPVVHAAAFDRHAALRIWQEHGYRHPELTDEDLKKWSTT